MNRQQRRKQARNERIGMVNLNDITFPQQMGEQDCRMMLTMRLMDNLKETGHPFHHLTANGVIVEPDPTQEYYLSRLPEAERESIRKNWLTRTKPDAPQAVPVNRKYYGHDPYERH